jgi:hypothetical protein
LPIPRVSVLASTITPDGDEEVDVDVDDDDE